MFLENFYTKREMTYMENVAKVKRFSFKKLITNIGSALSSLVAITIYHCIFFGYLIAMAFVNGNNTFVYGFVIAFASLVGMFLLGGWFSKTFHEKWGEPSKMVKWLVETFDLDYDNIDTFPQYIWLMTFPIVILLVSSSLVLIQPWFNPSPGNDILNFPIAVIDRGNSGDIDVVEKGEIRFFFPLTQRVYWYFGEQKDIEMSNLSLTTKDGKNVKGNAKLDLVLIQNKENIKRLYSKHGFQYNYNADLKKVITSSLKKSVARYDLEKLPTQIVIEDGAGAEIDLKEFGIKSVTIQLSGIHREFVSD